jgi:branched-chain amino acid transport system substrate-binding protein
MVFFSGFPIDAVNFLKQAGEQNLNKKILGPEVMNDPQIVQNGKEAANGLMFTTPKPQTIQQFKDAFKAKFGAEPLVYSDYYYDIVYLLANAINVCDEDSTCIKGELYKVKDYKGASGTITLDSNGDLANAEYIVKIIVNQTVVDYS